MKQIGLKLWSTNKQYVKPALELFANGVYNYIELYVEPDSVSYLEVWRNLDIPFILHAPHTAYGLNPSQKDCRSHNFELIDSVDKYREALNPKYIIFHPGVDGIIEETIRQFRELSVKYPEITKRMLVENKPLLGMQGQSCVGATASEIKAIINSVGIGFCLDFGHAIAAANSLKKSWMPFVKELLGLNPYLFHLSDGEMMSEMDSHLNLGAGNYPIAKIANILPDEAIVTLETAKDAKRNLREFVEDVEFLESFS